MCGDWLVGCSIGWLVGLFIFLFHCFVFLFFVLWFWIKNEWMMVEGTASYAIYVSCVM